MFLLKPLASTLALALTCAVVSGCADADPASDGGDGDGQGAAGPGGNTSAAGPATTSVTQAAGPSTTASTGGQLVEGTVGIVIIDVQETFVRGASNPDLPAVIERTKAAFQLADTHDVPFFVTFEDSKQGDHALHAPLVPFLPSQAQELIKTTFGATGLPAFASAIQQSGITHVIVLGAETDVCVMQTVLGLRDMGLTVLLERDAVMSEETNVSPALRRMQQAGTLLVTESEVAGFVANPNALPAGGDPPVRITRPLEMGVVINDLTDATLSGSGDPLKSQKLARLRELLLVSEWFELPVYVDDVGAGLPSQLADAYQGQLKPISAIAQDAAITQLVFAGTDASLEGAMSAWMDSRELFVMEDGLLAQGSAAQQTDMLAPFFERGLVPTTYKSFYYDMTKSVNPAEWPSQAWVQKLDEYWNLTQAPEDLPPLPGN